MRDTRKKNDSAAQPSQRRNEGEKRAVYFIIARRIFIFIFIVLRQIFSVRFAKCTRRTATQRTKAWRSAKVKCDKQIEHRSSWSAQSVDAWHSFFRENKQKRWRRRFFQILYCRSIGAIVCTKNGIHSYWSTINIKPTFGLFTHTIACLECQCEMAVVPVRMLEWIESYGKI